MAKQKKGDVTTVLMIIGGILILLSVIVVGIFVYQSVRWGPCWANFGQKMGEIEKAFEQKLMTQPSANVTVTMGDCVGALIFTDEKGLDKVEADEFRNVMECPRGENINGFVIGLPYFGDTSLLTWKFWTWPEKTRNKAVKAWEEMGRGIGPLCKGLDREVPDLEIKGPGEGKTKTLCLELVKIGESYGVSYREGSCG